MLFTSKLFSFVACVFIGSAAAASLASRQKPTECAAPSSAQIAANASKSAFVPVDPVGDVAAVFLPTSGSQQTRMYYQNQQGHIIQHTVAGGPFTTGSTFSINVLVKANLTRWGTPIAASGIGNQGVHVYYISNTCTLAEMRLIGGEWQGASANPCPQCIDSAGFVIAEGSQMLYAIQDPNNANLLRVGFESVGAPGTISEAVTTNLGRTWQIAPVPDQA